MVNWEGTTTVLMFFIKYHSKMFSFEKCAFVILSVKHLFNSVLSTSDANIIKFKT